MEFPTPISDNTIDVIPATDEESITDKDSDVLATCNNILQSYDKS
jgi:hypothetical protein